MKYQLLGLLAVAAVCLGVESTSSVTAAEALALNKKRDYYSAYRDAERQNKQLLIFFRDDSQKNVANSYESNELTDEKLRPALEDFVLAVLPLDTTVNGGDDRLLEHKAFRHLQNRQGIVVVDLVDPDSDLHGKVVSAHPFTEGRHMTAESTKIVLELPRGTITQRSMIYAARLNPYQPAGVKGKATTELLDFAQGHCHTMANWGSMHHSSFGGPEIVANNGGSATIVETAKSMIRMWQGSPPHWGILTGSHRSFALDMKRSSSGHWYATGVFRN